MKVLEPYRSPRVRLLVGLGFASGLPLFLSGSTLSAWLKNAGFDIKTIALFSLVSLPYSFKFLWAPLLDRFGLPFLGRRRGWMLVFQIGILLSLAGMATLGRGLDASTIKGMAVLATLLAFLSASQDVVIDAYRTDLLPEKERGSGTATYVTGYKIAMVLTGGLALVLSDLMPWPVVYTLMAAAMSVGIVSTLRAPHPPIDRPPRTLADAVVKPFADFFRQPRALVVLLFVMFFKFGDYVASTLNTPFLLGLGFTNTEVGTLNKILGMVAGILGNVVGGGIVDRMNVRRALLSFGILQALTNIGYVALAIAGKSYPLLVGAIAIDSFFGGVATVAFTAFIMALCHTSFSATQFALLTSASTIVGKLVAGGSGYLIEATSWALFYTLSIVVAAPALLLLRLVPDPRPRDQMA